MRNEKEERCRRTENKNKSGNQSYKTINELGHKIWLEFYAKFVLLNDVLYRQICTIKMILKYLMLMARLTKICFGANSNTTPKSCPV